MQPTLSHQLVTAEGASPQQWALVLHGILGMGTNFRTIVKAVAERAPAWGFILVDLRGHGASQGFTPPHDLDAAASDLEALVEQTKGADVRAVIGHSFGGKVALAYAGRHELDGLCVLDSNPGTRSKENEQEADSASVVLSTLESFGTSASWPNREAFRDAIRAAGYSAALADWLTMNVRREGDVYRLRLDLVAARALLESYYTSDLWHVLEAPRARSWSLLVATRSTVIDSASRERAQAAASTSGGRGRVHLIEAGHWLHVEEPKAVVSAIVELLSAAATLS